MQVPDTVHPPTKATPARRGLRWLLSGFLAVSVALLVGLGLWQVERLAWKQDLIARVDARVHADPVALPPATTWAGIDASADEYLRVQVEGRLRHDLEIPVYASTAVGPGYWIMTPLEISTGTIWINRGYVDNAHRERGTRPDDTGTPVRRIVGLLRLPEPSSLFLRDNVAAQSRWYRRDLQAMSAARGLPTDSVAPWFIDAQPDADDGPQARPLPGLTVVTFRNNHLSYALTWFALAALALLALGLVVRSEFRQRGRASDDRAAPVTD